MSKSHALLRNLRKVHLYLGVFSAPALLFFAFTGAMQSINLHETTQGSTYKPPAWIASLAQLHKKQTLTAPPRRPKPPLADASGGQSPDADKGSRHAKREAADAPTDSRPVAPKPVKMPDPPAAPQKNHLPMKIFFVLISVSLLTTTLTGIYMSFKYAHNTLLIAGLLIAGLVVPLLLLPF